MAEVQKAVLTVEDASIFLGMKKNYLYQLIFKKKIPCYRIVAGGRVYFKQEELEKFLFRNRQAADYEESVV